MVRKEKKFTYPELDNLVKRYKEIKTKKPIQVLTPTEIAIYELLSGEDIMLDVIPDHKHHHCYYVINREGSGRWRKYEHIIKFVVMRVEKVIKLLGQRPNKLPKAIEKTKPITLSLNERALLQIYEVAYERQTSLSAAASYLINNGHNLSVRKQLMYWKVKLEKTKHKS
ncbi:MAG: hypothetical protein KBS35_02040 [Mycoplasma sp.]|nr:hypothetical protein [Candidatus Hennigella equi]